MIYKNTIRPDDELPSSVAAELAGAVRPVPPNAATTARIRTRLMARIAGDRDAAPATSPATRSPKVASSQEDAAVHDRPQPASSAPVASGSGTAQPVAVQAMASAFITLRKSVDAGEGWVELLPKAHAKLLFTDGLAESYMIRLEPGARAPAHEHPADEECFVIEGSLWQGDVFLEAGDFHVARPGMKHGELRTDTGALVFIRYSRPLSEYIRL